MRIACIHIPQYALQCATRLDPSLRGAAIAMADLGAADGRGALHAPVVVACSRAAWALGVRLGMTATAARSTAPAVSVVAVESASERETMRAIADALLGLTATVDIGGRVGAGGAHLAMYAEVPQKTRGNTFGERALERLEQLGLTGRVGIADDRFTAWVAAAYGTDTARSDDHGTVTMVPRGGSPAFLAPRPLSLLAISVEVQHMLEALGVRTLGEFASLPAPSVARPLEADYRALARGESGAHLRAYTPDAAIREEVIVAAGTILDSTDHAVSGPSAIALVAKRIALRLEGRSRAAARIELSALAGVGTIRTITPDLSELSPLARAAQAELPSYIEPRSTPALTAAEDLSRAIAPILAVVPEDIAASAWRLRATVVGEAVTAMNDLDLAVTTELAMPIRTFEPVVMAVPAIAESSRVAALASGASVSSASASAGASVSSISTASAIVARQAVATGSQPIRASEPTQPRASLPVANSNHYRSSDLDTATPVAADPLAVVLSTSGALFALSPNEPSREHRRTRRGKQRRSRSMTAPVQARLFDRR